MYDDRHTFGKGKKGRRKGKRKGGALVILLIGVCLTVNNNSKTTLPSVTSDFILLSHIQKLMAQASGFIH